MLKNMMNRWVRTGYSRMGSPRALCDMKLPYKEGVTYGWSTEPWRREGNNRPTACRLDPLVAPLGQYTRQARARAAISLAIVMRLGIWPFMVRLRASPSSPVATNLSMYSPTVSGSPWALPDRTSPPPSPIPTATQLNGSTY